nr:uncharacterized protein LOC112321680 isoform X4 [Desmodus rotundus]
MVPGKSLTFSGPQLPHLRITSTTTDSNSKECVQKTAKDPSILPNTHMSTGAARARTRWSSAYTGLPGQPMGVRGGDGAPAERERSGGSMGRLPQCCVSPPCPRMLPGLNTR